LGLSFRKHKRSLGFAFFGAHIFVFGVYLPTIAFKSKVIVIFVQENFDYEKVRYSEYDFEGTKRNLSTFLYYLLFLFVCMMYSILYYVPLV
jgi:predicted permease